VKGCGRGGGRSLKKNIYHNCPNCREKNNRDARRPGRLRSWSGPVETDFQGRLRFSSGNRPAWQWQSDSYTYSPRGIGGKVERERGVCSGKVEHGNNAAAGDGDEG
jgi:hypothetical protein